METKGDPLRKISLYSKEDSSSSDESDDDEPQVIFMGIETHNDDTKDTTRIWRGRSKYNYYGFEN